MYLALKLIHILAVIAFLGNITTGVFWHAHAARTRDPRLLAHTMDGIIRSDRFFTMPGVFGILIGGIVGAILGGHPILGTGWILWSIVMFSISGIVFGTRLAPLQKQLRALAESGAKSGSFDYTGYSALARKWEVWGSVATLAPLVAAALMVLKPALPAF